VQKRFTYADPETIAKKRALEFIALSPTEKFNSLIKLIKISYEIRESRHKSSSPKP
jgi:hypothetical protein